MVEARATAGSRADRRAEGNGGLGESRGRKEQRHLREERRGFWDGLTEQTTKPEIGLG
jgi:hypothetical protein